MRGLKLAWYWIVTAPIVVVCLPFAIGAWAGVKVCEGGEWIIGNAIYLRDKIAPYPFKKNSKVGGK